MTAPTAATYTDVLVALAAELVCRVRDVGPGHNGLWLRSLTDDQRYGMLFALAAMVDPDVPLNVALGWTYLLEPPAAEVAAAPDWSDVGGAA